MGKKYVRFSCTLAHNAKLWERCVPHLGEITMMGYAFGYPFLHRYEVPNDGSD